MPFPATVTEIESLAPEVVQLTVSLHDRGFVFQPGQWVNFRFPEGVSRAYTIASAPERPQAVQLCIRVGSGKGGAALQKLQAGAAVTVDGPHGSFVLPEHGRTVALLAGDVGIAPVRSIVLHMLATSDPRKIVVLYEPDRRYILYAADFDPLARSGRIVHESGPIEVLVERNRALFHDDVVVMAAGFDPFLERTRQILQRVGYDPARAITETFGPQP